MTSATQAGAAPQPSVWDALALALSPIEQRPRVVANLEAAHQHTRAGTAYVVIRNPAANSYLKLDPREYDLLPLMDGTRTVKALVVEYYQRNGVLALPRVMRGTHVKMREVAMIKTATLTLRSLEQPMIVHVDGELREPGARECTVTLERGKLNVLVAR